MYVVFKYCAVEDNMVAVEDVQGCLGEVSVTSMWDHLTRLCSGGNETHPKGIHNPFSHKHFIMWI